MEHQGNIRSSEEVGSGSAEQAPVKAIILAPDQLRQHMPDDLLESLGYHVAEAETFEEAQELCHDTRPALIVTPLTLQNSSVVQYIKACREARKDHAIVVIARADEIVDAASSMRAGADDCLFLPINPQRLARTLCAAAKARKLDKADLALPAPSLDVVKDLDGLIGASPRMQDIFRKLEAVAATDMAVLIRGETGTGKSAMAKVLHNRSGRREAPFMTVDCAAMTDERFLDIFARDALPHGGTLFLDRVEEMPAAMQMRLLSRLNRDLEHQEPGTAFRVVSAMQDRADGDDLPRNMRADLYFKLNTVELNLPPLRNRRGDVVRIARRLLGSLTEAQFGYSIPVEPAVFDALSMHHWPGNMHELLGILNQLNLMASERGILVDDLPSHLARQSEHGAQRSRNSRAGPGAHGLTLGPLIGLTLAEIERAVIEATIKAESGSVPRAAKVLGLSPSTIYRKREGWTREDGS